MPYRIAARMTGASIFLKTVFSVTRGYPSWMWRMATNPSWQTVAHPESYATAKYTISLNSKIA
jgi:hypothetical protein